MKKINRFRIFENQSEISDIKKIIDDNEFISDKNVTENKLIESENWIIYISKQTLEHIESHLKPSTELGDAPGSYYTKDWKKGLENVISNYDPQSSPNPPFRTAWVGLDAGTTVGYVTIGYSEQIINGDLSGLKKYTYDRPIRGEKVKETILIKEEDATPTNFLTVVGSKIGEVNGKGLISLWTTYPDFKDGKIEGKSIPMNRNEFEENGFYFKCTPEFFDKVPTNEKYNNSIKIKTFRDFK